MKTGKRLISFILSFVLVFSLAFSTSALTDAEKAKLNDDIAALKKEASAIQSEINELKKEKNNQNAVVSAIRKKVANTQSQIDRCNQEINKINSNISANKAEIAQKEAEMEADVFQFKKRIRAIYMSDSQSGAKVLLGAENFAQFLQLSQLTSAVSSHDKALMQKLSAAIAELNEKNEENKKLLEQQAEIKSTVDKKKKELESQENEAAKVYNSIAAEQKQSESEKAAIDAQVRALQKQLEDDIKSKSYKAFINANTGMRWPIDGFFSVSSGFGPRWGTNHNGIDIAGGGIAGQPIRAIADGYVDLAYNGCSHNYKKNGNCCGNGYGNYCVVNHGTLNIKGSSASYVVYYAHAQRVTVSPGQFVKQGDIVGYVGTTGWSTGYHLHLGMLRNGGWVNPYPYFF